MVELLEEDAKGLAEWFGDTLASYHHPIYNRMYYRIYHACADALKADNHEKAVQK